jgi:ferrous iron transport protein B
VAHGKIICKPHRIKNVPKNIDKAIKKLRIEIEKQFPNIPNSRWIAFRLLEGDAHIIDALKNGELV